MTNREALEVLYEVVGREICGGVRWTVGVEGVGEVGAGEVDHVNGF